MVPMTWKAGRGKGTRGKLQEGAPLDKLLRRLAAANLVCLTAKCFPCDDGLFPQRTSHDQHKPAGSSSNRKAV